MHKPKVQLPPQMPESKDKLERAICLLGNRVKAELTSKPHQELVALLGTYPNPKEAAAWKQLRSAVAQTKTGIVSTSLLR